MDPETDYDLILCVRGFIFLLLGGHMLPDFSGNLVHLISDVQADPLAPLGAIWCTSFDCSQLPMHILVTYRDQLDFMSSYQGWPTLAVEALSYPSDEYIRWYRGITRVYIGNPANRDTRSVGYQPARVDRWMMVHSTNKFCFLFKHSYAFHLFMLTSNNLIFLFIYFLFRLPCCRRWMTWLQW
ncbi:hypothetical protein M9H77_01557 [Catharanthus roseus]|uniref:Uncharacterized protein n=1 Tax=Catharanthus roseus TaxID=4058 RepID=A0ACC0C5W5_CATRO|nr:hypothetical protein M9H77_01557 [Catharanthus roseus]